MAGQSNALRYRSEELTPLVGGLVEVALGIMDAADGRQEGEFVGMVDANELLNTENDWNVVRWKELQHELEEERKSCFTFFRCDMLSRILAQNRFRGRTARGVAELVER